MAWFDVSPKCIMSLVFFKWKWTAESSGHWVTPHQHPGTMLATIRCGWNSRMALWLPENVTRATTDSKLHNDFVGRVKMCFPIRRASLCVKNVSKIDLNQNRFWWIWPKVPFDVNQSSEAGSLSHKHTHTHAGTRSDVQRDTADCWQRSYVGLLSVGQRLSAEVPCASQTNGENFTFDAAEWNTQEGNYYSEWPLPLPSLGKNLMVAYMLGSVVAGRIKLVLYGFEHVILSNTFHRSSLICQGDIAR